MEDAVVKLSKIQYSVVWETVQVINRASREDIPELHKIYEAIIKVQIHKKKSRARLSHSQYRHGETRIDGQTWIWNAGRLWQGWCQTNSHSMSAERSFCRHLQKWEPLAATWNGRAEQTSSIKYGRFIKNKNKSMSIIGSMIRYTLVCNGSNCNVSECIYGRSWTV